MSSVVLKLYSIEALAAQKYRGSGLVDSGHALNKASPLVPVLYLEAFTLAKITDSSLINAGWRICDFFKMRTFDLKTPEFTYPTQLGTNVKFWGPHP